MSSIDQRIAQWIRPEIRALSAYHVPDAAGLIKLDAMENPYTWPDDLIRDWLDALAAVPLNRYPDPGAAALRQRLGTAFGIPDGMGLLLGNGSDELIQMLAMAVAEPGRTIMAPEPGFVMYRMIATFVGMEYIGVPLRAADFSLDREAMLQAIARHQPAIVFLAYPNNPTGNQFAQDDVHAVIEAAPGLVVVDEAYAAFADHSFLDELHRYDNLLVMRTVSKMGLAGLRLGLLAGAQPWIEQLDKIRLPYNINVLTQASAEFALRHKAVLDRQTAAVRRDREPLQQALQRLDGVQPFPSQANFILFRTPPGTADRLFAQLRADGVLIKNLNGSGGLLADCLRVTVGRPDENDAFLAALGRALAQL
ncbi:MAG: histidinol-phosphate transaminase [Gammaproteobacteria bacterium]